ncbi:uncharacterized protein HMPREF1541_00028 [Cyphellophora europaea CBS 101466]|uniref:Uncharacterized protein n=1 Tax=Cyphellophora europaea (strain CBS 101466) TaxID=1220924 RepID=W2SAW9_CYPE1|nr:uncharacterized protein HMPREF1541_00028 [Cyphellophora europaea CBS 101466]ETN45847.1 hypothetical protein HMPREF1541_00028 [Cyphellophora europaea CBS 101466]
MLLPITLEIMKVKPPTRRPNLTCIKNNQQLNSACHIWTACVKYSTFMTWVSSLKLSVQEAHNLVSCSVQDRGALMSLRLFR